MYSFSPIATEICHNGWFILALIGSLMFGVFIMSIDEDVMSASGKFSWILILIIGMNYVGDWTVYEKVHTNEKVIGEFVGFQPEGYNEKSGKSRADHHYMYVIYKVPGDKLVILQSASGVDYPKQAILYKN